MKINDKVVLYEPGQNPVTATISALHSDGQVTCSVGAVLKENIVFVERPSNVPKSITRYCTPWVVAAA